MAQIKLIGVTGGIATGKSAVCKILETFGMPLIDFDILSREVVALRKPAWKDIISFFGDSVLNKDKSVNRASLRKIVFQDPEKLKKLESFIHPRVKDSFISLTKAHFKKKPNSVIQAGVPLLIEANMRDMFDYIVLVWLPFDKQIKRLIKRDNILYEQAKRIIDSQMPIEKKKKYADYIIDNSGSLQNTEKQIIKLVDYIMSAKNDYPK
ncbi:MAG: dephospho-CoA kinase [Deltaproteobacteria bacterium]|nr:dephospho-CoA kinase [Deltaproteobacteria bacterium]